MGLKRAQLAWHTRDLTVNALVNGPFIPNFARGRLWTAIGHRISRSATVNSRCFLGSRTGLTVGPRSFVNYGCFFDLGAPTTIGADCAIGYEVMFITCSHELSTDATESRAGSPTVAPITIGDRCWIGARVTILPGITIGDGTVIAAGSTVTTDCEPDSLYAGSPAVFKRALHPSVARTSVDRRPATS